MSPKFSELALADDCPCPGSMVLDDNNPGYNDPDLMVLNDSAPEYNDPEEDRVTDAMALDDGNPEYSDPDSMVPDDSAPEYNDSTPLNSVDRKSWLSDDDEYTIHCGPQPHKTRKYVPHIPQDKINKYLHRKLQDICKRDQGSCKLSDDQRAELQTNLANQCLKFFTPAEDNPNMFEAVSGITGLALSFDGCSPNGLVIDAMHGSAIATIGGKPTLVNHAPSNVIAAEEGPNIARRFYYPLVYSLISQLTKADPVGQKAEHLWLCQTITNQATALTLLGGTGIAANRREAFRDRLPEDQVRAIEISGTLEKNQLMRELLSKSTPQKSFVLDGTKEDGGWGMARRLRGRWKHPSNPKAPNTYALYHQRMDNALRKIARDRLRHLNLQDGDIDTLFFTRDRFNKPVFYPGHPWFRPIHRELGYDYATLFVFCRASLYLMRNFCNRHGEKLGLGETRLDEETLVCMMMHILCDRVLTLWASHPGDSAEAIALRLGDETLGLPMMVSRSHPLSLSFCKVEHGTAMFSGYNRFRYSAEGDEVILGENSGRYFWDEGFDPVESYDERRRTITMEAQFTNNLCWNYPRESRGYLRDIVMTVADRSPFFAIDPRAGLEIWNTKIDAVTEHGVQPRMPDSEFNDDLQVPDFDVKVWSEGATPKPLQCCGTSFEHVGLWIRHAHDRHSRLPKVPCPEPGCEYVSPSPAHDGLHRHFLHHTEAVKLKEYWDRACEVCNTSFSHFRDLLRHTKERHWRCPSCSEYFASQAMCQKHLDGGREGHQTSDKPIPPAVHICAECPKQYARRAEFVAHVQASHYYCPHFLEVTKDNICASAYFETEEEAMAHIRQHHIGSALSVCSPAKLRCGIGQCDRTYTNHKSRQGHWRDHHNHILCLQCEPDYQAYPDEDSLKEHERTDGHDRKNFRKRPRQHPASATTRGRSKKLPKTDSGTSAHASSSSQTTTQQSITQYMLQPTKKEGDDRR
ncbi:hypothetical protein F4805DRAFT_435207 [Annulohypoxylon moriforme]|nr:hypothetical protein F4805DRAFT_435207 [Annulohypoxylon moriforme]